MHEASRVLGTQVSSTAPVFLAFLAVHVLAGLTAVATGAVAALSRKGGQRHIRAGRWFYRAITVVFATAAVLGGLRWRQDYHLVIIGAVAFAAATAGVLHRRWHRPGDTGHIVGMGGAYVAMLTAFYVDNGPHLPLWDRLPPIVFWFLPALIGAPVTIRALIKARERATDQPAGLASRREDEVVLGSRGAAGSKPASTRDISPVSVVTKAANAARNDGNR